MHKFRKLYTFVNYLQMIHPLTNFKIKKYYRSEYRFNSVCSSDNLPNK